MGRSGKATPQLRRPIAAIAADPVQEYERLPFSTDVHSQAWKRGGEADISVHAEKSLHAIGYRGSIE
jgi:hypothetical protein